MKVQQDFTQMTQMFVEIWDYFIGLDMALGLYYSLLSPFFFFFNPRKGGLGSFITISNKISFPYLVFN